MTSTGWQVNPTRDVDATAYPDSDQTLTVYCTGTGHYDLLMEVVAAGVGAGKQSTGAQHIACTLHTTIDTGGGGQNIAFDLTYQEWVDAGRPTPSAS